MRSRPGAALIAIAVAACIASSTGCATTTVVGKPTAARAAATGLAAKPLDEILTAVANYAAKQKSVHVAAREDGQLFTEADVSYDDTQGVTTVEKKKLQFRTIGARTYVRSSGRNWSRAGDELGATIRAQTRLDSIIQEIDSLKKNVKDARPRTSDVIVLRDAKGNEADIANDPDSPQLQAFRLTIGSTKAELVLTDWSEQTLHLKAPPVS